MVIFGYVVKCIVVNMCLDICDYWKLLMIMIFKKWDILEKVYNWKWIFVIKW